MLEFGLNSFLSLTIIPVKYRPLQILVSVTLNEKKPLCVKFLSLSQALLLHCQRGRSAMYVQALDFEDSLCFVLRALNSESSVTHPLQPACFLENEYHLIFFCLFLPLYKLP